MDPPPNYELTDNLPVLDGENVADFFEKLQEGDGNVQEKDNMVQKPPDDAAVPMDVEEDDPADSETEGVTLKMKTLGI